MQIQFTNLVHVVPLVEHVQHFVNRGGVYLLVALLHLGVVHFHQVVGLARVVRDHIYPLDYGLNAGLPGVYVYYVPGTCLVK